MPIQKCSHGSYIPEGESQALYCRLCVPDGPTNTKDVVLPRSSSDPLDEAGRTYANNRSGKGCPQCGCHIYLRKKETNDAQRECADCGAGYRVRLSDRQKFAAMQLEEECLI
jgi:hypothetical protein